MSMLKRTALAGCLAAAGLLAATAVQAIPTNVQLNWNGVVGFDTTGINQFDWQSSGDLVIRNVLPGSFACGLGTCTTFSAWAGAATVGQSVTFGFEAQARLNDLLNSAGGSVAPGALNTTGILANGGFEITAAFSGFESATLISAGVLQFTSITGSYKWFFDTTPDSNVATGAGFLDGVELLRGTLTGVNGFFGSGGGNSNLTNTVTGYNNLLIETDPLTNAPLIGTTFDTLVTFAGGLQAQICNTSPGPNCPIGLTPYNVLLADLRFKADANSKFQGTAVPEPGTALLVGAGLLGLAWGARRKQSSS